MTMSILERNRRAIDPVRIASVIRASRESTGWSQYVLADRAGTTRHMVAKMERGQTVRLETLFLAATALGIDIDELFKRARDVP